MARSEVGERIEAGDPDAMRCFLSLRDVEPNSFSLRYRMYRIEGVEPEGLDQIVRSHDRLELATRIAVVHGLADELEEIKFHPMSCRPAACSTRWLGSFWRAHLRSLKCGAAGAGVCEGRQADFLMPFALTRASAKSWP